MAFSRPLFALLWGLAAILPLTACDELGEDTRGESRDGGDAVRETEQVIPVPTDMDLAGGSVFADRAPGDGSRAIIVPVTSLVPGTAPVAPAIANPYNDPEAVAAGERHFAAFNCSGCHAPLGGGGMGPSLSDDDWIYGGDPAQIYLSIMHGRPDGMPTWGAMLPEKTAWELVAYIESLNEIDDYPAKLGFNENVEGYRADTSRAETETSQEN